tara:strand:+ start:1759 stop:2250 length:492 start_codon:yes stop_codon:yes gene_type:complete
MATTNAATTYLEHRILNFIFNNNAQVSSANFGSGNANGLGSNIYVGLATAVSNFSDSTGESADAGSVSVTEATFGGYARQQTTAWTLVSPTANQQTAKNTNAIDFPAKTDGGTQTITHVFINDASSSSGTNNFLFIGALDASKTLAEGDIFRINATNLSIELK